jgi:hypothetical protein
LRYTIKRLAQIAAVAITASGAFALLFASRPSQAQRLTGSTARQKFKNIKVLGDMPADQLGKVMNLMAQSLGVGCTHCHVGYEFEKDGNPKKEAARRMLRMTFALNRQNFNGRLVVSCNTCHNGHPEPKARPELAPVAENKPTPPSDDHPTAQQIVERYEQGVGIRAAAASVRTRYIKAERIEPDGSKEPEEIWQDASGKMKLLTSYPSNYTISEGFDGRTAWKTSNGTRIDLKADEIEQIRQNALVGFVSLSAIYRKFELSHEGTIDGRRVFVIAAETDRGTRDELSFDALAGWLLRRESNVPTVLGDFVYRVDFSEFGDYRGVRLAGTTKFSMPGVSWTRRIKTVEVNPSLAPTIFSAPQSVR